MAAADFNDKKWKLEKKDQHFDDFLKAMGVGMLKRTTAGKASPVLEITQNGDDFTVVTKGPLCSHEVKFTMGTEFTAEDPISGKKVKMMPTWDGSKQVIKNVDDPDGVVATREIEGDKMIMTQAKGTVVTKRTFGKQ